MAFLEDVGRSNLGRNALALGNFALRQRALEQRQALQSRQLQIQEGRFRMEQEQFEYMNTPQPYDQVIDTLNNASPYGAIKFDQLAKSMGFVEVNDAGQKIIRRSGMVEVLNNMNNLETERELAKGNLDIYTQRKNELQRIASNQELLKTSGMKPEDIQQQLAQLNQAIQHETQLLDEAVKKEKAETRKTEAQAAKIRRETELLGTEGKESSPSEIKARLMKQAEEQGVESLSDAQLKVLGWEQKPPEKLTTDDINKRLEDLYKSLVKLRTTKGVDAVTLMLMQDNPDAQAAYQEGNIEAAVGELHRQIAYYIGLREGKAVTRIGTHKNGRIVAEFEDGTIQFVE